MLVTASADGVPNLNHLSHVFLVDDQHVAISNQFFTKTTRNLCENPLATIVVTEPGTLRSYKLLLHFERTETAGPTFDTMRRSINAIAALVGMSDVFALRSAEIFRVLDLTIVPTPGALATE